MEAAAAAVEQAGVADEVVAVVTVASATATVAAVAVLLEEQTV